MPAATRGLQRKILLLVDLDRETERAPFTQGAVAALKEWTLLVRS
jgi:hypothetical protein